MINPFAVGPFDTFSVDKQIYPFLNVDISKFEPTKHETNLKNIYTNKNYNAVEQNYFYAKYLLTNTIPENTYIYLASKMEYRKLKSDELIEYGKRLEEVFPDSINELIELYKNNNLEKIDINNVINRENIIKSFKTFKTFFKYKLLDLIDNSIPSHVIGVYDWLSYFISLPEHFFKGYLVFRCICILDANKHNEIINDPAELAKRKVIKGDTTFHAEFPSPGDFSEIFLTKPYHNVILNQFNVDFSKVDLIKSRHDFFLFVEPIYRNLNDLRTNSVSRELFRINNQKFALLGNLTIGEYNKSYNLYIRYKLKEKNKELQIENDDLKTKNNDLTNQINILQSEKTNLESKLNHSIINEYDEKSLNQLILYKDQLRLEKNKLETKYNELKVNHDNLEKEYQSLKTSNDQLNTNYDNLEEEKNELSKNNKILNSTKTAAINRQIELIKEKSELNNELTTIKQEKNRQESINKKLHDENVKLRQELTNVNNKLSTECLEKNIELVNKLQTVENINYDLYHQLGEAKNKIKKMLEALKVLIEELRRLMEKMENVKTSHEDNSLLVYKLIDILKSNSDELMNNVTLNEESIKQCISDVNNTVNTIENTFLL